MAEDNNIFKDLDILDPEKKLVKMAGKIFDITIVPAKVTLDAMKTASALENKKITADIMFEKMIETVAKIGQKTDPEITTEWVENNVSVDKIAEFMHVLIAPDDDEDTGKGEGESSKN